MDIDYATKEEMKALSKEVFGSSSRWQTMLKKGYSEVVTRTVTEEIPGENGAEPTVKETKVPVLTESGGRQSRHKNHTVESLKALMFAYKVQRDAFLAEHKRKQEEEAAKKAQAELDKKITEEVSGSAL